MSMNSMDELRSRYVAGEQLSSDDTSSLLQWLNDHPDQRRDFLVDEAIDNQLRCLVRLNDKDSTQRFIDEAVQKAVALSQNGDSLDVVQIRSTNRTRTLPPFSVPAGLCAAALVFAGIALTWYVTLGRQQTDFGFAQIMNAKDISWELIDDESRRLRVSSGQGEVQFENGTTAQLVAPVVIELRNPGNLYVKTGSVKINVPPSAIGFTVDTPIARIVDYGTEFDVDVEDSGQTETRVRSGTVTFETHSIGLERSDPIKLTVEGLNRAAAEASDLSTDVRYVTTTASGTGGQFFGTIQADGETAEFGTRQQLDDFLNRLSTGLETNPTQFDERATEQSTVDNSVSGESTTVESKDQSNIPSRPPGGRAQEMMIEQLRAMQGNFEGNPQMQELLEGMIRQAEENKEKIP